jgi:hypothetical protein
LSNIEIIVKEKEHEMKQFRRQLMVLCQQLDEDESGSLTYNEIVDGFKNNTEFFDMMEAMDIMPEDIASVWGILDCNHNGKVDYEEFCDELFKMKAEDSHTMTVFIKYQVAEIRETVQAAHAMLQAAQALTEQQNKTDLLVTAPKLGAATASTNDATALDTNGKLPLASPQETKLDASKAGLLLPVMDAFKSDIRQEIAKKSQAVEIKLDETTQLLHALMDGMQLQRMPMLDPGQVEGPYGTAAKDTIHARALSPEIDALIGDIRREIAEKSRTVEVKLDATAQLLHSLITDVHFERVPMLDPELIWGPHGNSPQGKSNGVALAREPVPRQPVTPRNFRCMPSQCHGGAATASPPSSTSGNACADAATYSVN